QIRWNIKLNLSSFVHYLWLDEVCDALYHILSPHRLNVGGMNASIDFQLTRIHDIVEKHYEFSEAALCFLQKVLVSLRWDARVKLRQQFEIPLHAGERRT